MDNTSEIYRKAGIYVVETLGIDVIRAEALSLNAIALVDSSDSVDVYFGLGSYRVIDSDRWSSDEGHVLYPDDLVQLDLGVLPGYERKRGSVHSNTAALRFAQRHIEPYGLSNEWYDSPRPIVV